jgi:diguanylate cyclase (GGDEF)-like protein/PAS domain S-box-containing protein
VPTVSSTRLSGLSGEFQDKTTEQAYRTPLLREQARFTRRIAIIGTLFYASFLLVDYLHLGVTGDFLLRAVARGGMLLAGLAIADRVGRTKSVAALDRWTTLFIILLFLSFYAVLFSHPPLVFTHTSFFVALGAIFIAAPGSLALILTLATAGSLFYLLSLQLSATGLWNNVIPVSLLLLFANVFGALVRRELVRSRHEAYLALCAERSAKEELAQSGDELKRLFSAAPVALVLTRVRDGRLFKANDAALDLIGYARENLNSDFSVRQLYVHLDQRLKLIDEVMHRHRATGVELTLRRGNGEVIDTIASAVRVPHAGEDCIMVGLVDISERKRLEKNLRRMATTDPLTGLHNRHHFFETARKEIARCRRFNHPVSVIMIDVDHFKATNDRFGHDTGDAVLRAFSQTASATLRTHDILARFGGEEFVVMLPETGLEASLRIAERLRAAVEAQVLDFEPEEIRCTISLGVTELNADDASIDTALTRADRALYRAKRTGRNRVEPATATEPTAAEPS